MKVSQRVEFYMFGETCTFVVQDMGFYRVELDEDVIGSLFKRPMDVGALSQAGGAFIRKKLRELSFLRKIVPKVEIKDDI